ncbi:SRPBCC family protein [Streptomyces sp. CB02009]|uniref:SRPBCC family protein n=1 Tax=Streptomyces sp. CB02009 TaxID=1703938 RepID=UPI000938C088|nr:SRPBCC family protein [Streptomyces sp. CB02009]
MKSSYVLYNSTIIEAPVDVVWAEMRDLAHLVDIIMVANQQAYDLIWIGRGGPDSIPSTMQLNPIHESLPSGHVVRQEVTGRCEASRKLSYRVTQNDIGIENHQASYALKEVTTHPELTFWEWYVAFSVGSGANETILVKYFKETVADNIDKIRRHFAGAGRGGK